MKGGVNLKLTKLANFYLQYMINEYYKTHNRTFTNWEEMVLMFPNEDEKIICDAFIKLNDDGLIKIFWASNIPYGISLNINAIVEAEQNTRLRKTYACLKELKSWL